MENTGMSSLEEQILTWSENEFNIRLDVKNVKSLFKSRNGPLYRKLFAVLVEHVKSQKNGTAIKEKVDAINDQQKLQSLKEQRNELCLTLNNLSSTVLFEQENGSHASAERKGELAMKNVVMESVVDVLDSMSSKMSKSTRSITLDDLISSISNSKLTIEDVKVGGDYFQLDSPEEKCLNLVDIQKCSDEIEDLIDDIEGMMNDVANCQFTMESENLDERLESLVKSETQCTPKRVVYTQANRQHMEMVEKLANVTELEDHVAQLLEVIEEKRTEQRSRFAVKFKKATEILDAL